MANGSDSSVIRLKKSLVGWYASSITLVAYQAVGAPGAEVAVLVAAIAGAALAFGGGASHLPIILLLSMPRLGMSIGQAAESSVGWVGGIGFRDAVVSVPVGGVEVNVPLAILGGALLRFMAGIVRRERTLTDLRGWQVLYVCALAIAAVGALRGYELGLNRWSQGMRAILAIGGLFWGVRVARETKTITAVLGTWRRIVVGGAFLCTIGVLRGQLLILLMGPATAYVIVLAREHRWTRGFLVAVTSLTGLLALTLTTAGTALVTWASQLAAESGKRISRAWSARAIIGANLLVVALALWAVLSRPEAVQESRAAVDIEQSIRLRTEYKLFSDRGPLWIAAVEQIAAGPLVVPPAGRPLLPRGAQYAQTIDRWEWGAHNAVLELVRQTGIISGGIGITMMILALWNAGALLTTSRDRDVKALAAGTVACVTVGAVTGNFLVYDQGFFIWVLAGCLIAIRRSDAGRMRVSVSTSQQRHGFDRTE